MRLNEVQSKSLFARHNLPIPEGRVAATPQEARRYAEEVGGTVAVKAQVPIGGRGKAGGIRLADTPAGAEAAAAALLGVEIRGYPVRELLIEEAVDIDQEIYLGITLDRTLRRMVMMASAEGGVEIEQVAHERPEAIHKAAIDPLQGLTAAQTQDLAAGIGLPEALSPAFDRLARGLYEVLTAHDALLAEINPLVITGQGELLALDGKMTIDDNALYRHPDLSEMRRDEASRGDSASPDAESASEREAREAGLSYVQLGGEIGCVVNGAGLAMATMDVIKLFGGVPANFLDVGGGARSERVALALRLVLGAPGIKALLINIFGGITLCDEVARGIVAALGEVQTTVPFVVRLVGTNEERGQEILRNSGYPLIVAETLADAAKKVVAAAAGAQV